MRGLLLFVLLIISNGIFAQLAGELGVLDLTANGGINPSTGLAWQLDDTYRLVFVSNATRDATSSDINDYNTHVQSAANAAGHGSVNWYAICSTNTVDARDNTFTTSTDTDGSFFLMDGSVVTAKNISDLWDGTATAQIKLDENGNLRPNNTSVWGPWTGVWTGTKSNGTADGTRHLGAGTVTIGLARAELIYWIRRANNVTSSANLPVYGMSEVLRVQNVLPVDLLSFDAKVTDDNELNLSWETAFEENNDYFTVERSLNRVDWEALEKISGAGNSSSVTSYETVDKQPYQGTSYYRLKQTDFNGQFAYSKVITKSIRLKNSIAIYPNPAIDVVTVVAKECKLQDLTIFNTYGQDVTHLIQAQESGQEKFFIDLSGLNKGVYFVKVKDSIKKLYKDSNF